MYKVDRVSKGQQKVLRSTKVGVTLRKQCSRLWNWHFLQPARTFSLKTPKTKVNLKPEVNKTTFNSVLSTWNGENVLSVVWEYWRFIQLCILCSTCTMYMRSVVRPLTLNSGDQCVLEQDTEAQIVPKGTVIGVCEWLLHPISKWHLRQYSLPPVQKGLYGGDTKINTRTILKKSDILNWAKLSKSFE